MCACTPANLWYLELKKKHDHQSEGSDCICSTLVKVPHGLLYPGLGPPAQEGCGAVTLGPEGCHKNDQRLEHL